MGIPNSTGHSNGEKFLPFDAYPFVFAKCLVGRPPSLEPLPTNVPPKPNGIIICIGEQFHVWRRGSGGVKKKGATIPPSKESLPHRKILKKFLFEADMMKTILNASRKIDNTL